MVRIDEKNRDTYVWQQSQRGGPPERGIVGLLMRMESR